MEKLLPRFYKLLKFSQERQSQFLSPKFLSPIFNPKKARNENLQKHILSNCDSSLDLSGNLPSYTLVTPAKAPSGGINGDQNDGIIGKPLSVTVKLEPKNDQSSKKDANTENKM